jgi:hypothetical protein
MMKIIAKNSSIPQFAIFSISNASLICAAHPFGIGLKITSVDFQRGRRPRFLPPLEFLGGDE